MASAKRVDWVISKVPNDSPNRPRVFSSVAVPALHAAPTSERTRHISAAEFDQFSNEKFSDYIDFQRATQLEGTKNRPAGSSKPVNHVSGARPSVNIFSQPEAPSKWRVVDIDSQQSEVHWPPQICNRDEERRPSSASSVSSEKDASPNSTSPSSGSTPNVTDKEKFLDRFLAQIYERPSHRSVDSDTFTEASLSEAFLSYVNSPCASYSQRSKTTLSQSAVCGSDFEEEQAEATRALLRSESHLGSKSRRDLSELLRTLQTHVQHVSAQLVRQLRRRDHAIQRRTRYYDVISAIVQATSEHRSTFGTLCLAASIDTCVV